MPSDYNIYVIFNEHQASAAERIIETAPRADRTVVFTTIESERSFPGCEVIRCSPYESFQEVAVEVFLRRRKKILHSISRTISKKSSVNLFVPHYQHIISNYLAFFLLRGPRLTRILIPDGVLSYYQHRVTWRDILKQLKYKTFCIATGLNYKMLWRSMNFPDNLNSAIYTYSPESVYNESAKVIPIRIVRKSLPKKFSNIIILGTDLYRRDHFSYAERVASWLSHNQNGSRVYFKQHPALRTADPILNFIRENVGGLAITEIPRSESMEGLIELHSIQRVIALAFTTAAIELQLIYNNELDISVYAPKILASPHHNLKFRDLAQKFNLKFES